MLLTLRARTVGWLLASAIVLLTIADFGLGHLDHPIWRLVNLDEEASFGTWFSSFIALGGALLAFLLALNGRRTGTAWVWWALLALVLATLSVDEVAQVHEGISTRIGEQARGVEDISMSGTPILGLLALPFLLLAMWQIFKASGRRAAWLIIAGLAVFWLGAFAFEELEYLNFQGNLFLTQNMTFEDGDFLLVGIQEALEMAGIGLTILGLIQQLSSSGKLVQMEVIGLVPPSPEPGGDRLDRSRAGSH